MKYWEKALKKLENSDLTFNAIYNTAFSFSDNVFYEIINENHIEKTTYSECQSLIENAASNLSIHLKTFEKNSYIALKLENGENWIISFWAILMCGHIPVLINTKYDELTLDYIFDELNIKCVISESKFKNYDYINPALLKKESNKAFTPTWSDTIVLSTSGTSGTPKLCVFNGKSISSQILDSKYVNNKNSSINSKYKGESKLLAFLPFYHVFGLIAHLLWFSFFGVTFVFLRDYMPETILSTCKRHGVTHVFAIPLFWNTIAETVEKKAKNKGSEAYEKFKKGIKLSIFLQTIFFGFGRFISNKLLFKNVRKQIFGESVKFCISGGSYIKRDTLEIINALGYPLYNGYGMTEVGITSVELSKQIRKRLEGNIGKPFPSANYKIENNELLIKGDSLFLGYIKNGKLNKRDTNKWFNTNDFANVDGHENYSLNGRIDDIIINEDGENISPEIIESNFNINYSNRICVVGLKGLKNVYDIALFIEPKQNISGFQYKKMLIEANETNNKLPINQKIKRTFVLEDKIPTALETKTKRSLLKESFEKGLLKINEIKLTDFSNKLEVLSEEEKNILSFVKDSMAQILEVEIGEIKDNSHFLYDLNGNSFTYFALITSLEQEYGVTFHLTKEDLCVHPMDFVKYIVKA